MISSLILNHHSTSIHIYGAFSIHHKGWLIYSNKTDKEDRYCHDFSIAYEMTQTVNKPTCVPDTTGHHVNLFLTSCHEKYSAELLPLLKTSDN